MSSDKDQQVAKKHPRRHAGTGLYVKAASGMKVRHRKVRRLVEKMRAEMPWLESSDFPACRAWAELEILCANAFSELLVSGLLNVEGEPRRLLMDFRQLRQVQLAYARELGMTPAARMAIKANGTRAAVDLAAAMASLAQSHADSNEVGDSTDRTDGVARENPSKHRLRARTETNEAVEEEEEEEEEEDVD